MDNETEIALLTMWFFQDLLPIYGLAVRVSCGRVRPFSESNQRVETPQLGSFSFALISIGTEIVSGRG